MIPILLALLSLLIHATTAVTIKVLYTSNVAGHLYEVDGDGRTCTRFPNNGSLVENEGVYAPVHSCSGGAAGRQKFVNEYYQNNGNAGEVIMLDTGNHFYGSREYFYDRGEKIAQLARGFDYDVMVLSSKDLHAEQSEIKSFIDNMQLDSKTTPFVASNLVLNSDSTTNQGDLFDLLTTQKIKQWHVVTIDSGKQVVVFSLLPKDAALRSRCTDTSDVTAAVQVLGQNSPSEEWLMSQVSHLNRLWERVKDEVVPNYAILIADLPMSDVVTLTRVLSFIDIGIGASAPTQIAGVCDPASMTLTNCAPLNGQPIKVVGETGIPRVNPSSGFFMSFASAPMDVPAYTNATWLETRNGRSVGVFEHDPWEMSNPWGNMYQVNNREWIVPNSLLDSAKTNIDKSWLITMDETTSVVANEFAKLLGAEQTTAVDTNTGQPQGKVSQPVYGEALGTQVYRRNRFRQVGCGQADCPMGRLFLNSMLAAASKHTENLCQSETGGFTARKNVPWCIAIVNGDSFATSVSSYGQSWRDGNDPFDQRGLRPPDEEEKERKKNEYDDFEKEEQEVEAMGGTNGMADLPDDDYFDDDYFDPMTMSGYGGVDDSTMTNGGESYQDDSMMTAEPVDTVDAVRRLQQKNAATTDSGEYALSSQFTRKLLGPRSEEEVHHSRYLAPTAGKGGKTGNGNGNDPAPVVPPDEEQEVEEEQEEEQEEEEEKEKAKAKEKEMENEQYDSTGPYGERQGPLPPDPMKTPDSGKKVKTSSGIKRLPDFTYAPPSYSLSKIDLRAACPYSLNANGEPRVSDRLYYVDMDMDTLNKFFVAPLNSWNYQTKNFGTFLAAGTSIPYSPSWRIRRTPAQWPMVSDVPPDQKVRLIGTYHDLTLGPYWDGYSQTHRGVGPPTNIMKNGDGNFNAVKPITFAQKGETTAAHAVGMFLREKMYQDVNGPWVNAFVSKEDEHFNKEVLNALPSYVFDDTVNCTMNNEHDALLGDYCNNVVYNAVKDDSPFVTPGRQDIYMAYPNTSSAVDEFQTQLSTLKEAVRRFRSVIGGLPKTDVFLEGTSSTDLDGGFSKIKNDVISNDGKIGSAPSAVLGPLNKAGRRRLKTGSAGVSDKYVQLRYDISAEDDKDIANENGGKVIYFGTTRKDRSHALRKMIRYHNWTAATILHEKSYEENAGVSCATLKRRFGCNCAESNSGHPAHDSLRFWCVNVDDAKYQGQDNAGNDNLQMEMFERLLGIHTDIKIDQISNDNNIDQDSHRFYATYVADRGTQIFPATFNSSSAKKNPNIYVLMINNQTTLNRVMSMAKKLDMLNRKKNKVFIVYESDMLESPSLTDHVPSTGAWILGLGRVSTPDINGAAASDNTDVGRISTTSKESTIIGYEASVAYLYGVDGAYNLLLEWDQKKRAEALKSANTVHGVLDELVYAYLNRFPLLSTITGLHDDVQMGHPSYQRRCSVFDVIVLNGTNGLNHRGSMKHNCTYLVTDNYPAFIYAPGSGSYAFQEFPKDEFKPGTVVDMMWELAIMLPCILICVFCCCGGIMGYWRRNARLLKKQKEELKLLQDSNSVAWQLNPNDISFNGEGNPVLGQGAYGIVLRAKHMTTPCVVKQFHAGSTVGDSEFIHEMVALRDMRHVNLVLMMGACKLEAVSEQIPGGWSIVSEFLQGGDVEQLLHEKKQVEVTPYVRLKIAIDAARGIAYLHDKGFAHKDLKTANLMLDGPVHGAFKCKVADFGCGKLNNQSKHDKLVNQNNNKNGQAIIGLMKQRSASDHEFKHLSSLQETEFKGIENDDGGTGGTAVYLPPEVQLAGEEYGKHSDAFAFGVILAELLTRTPPYSNTGLSAQAVILRVGNQGLRPIAPNSEDVPKINDPLREMYNLATQCWLPAYGTPCREPKDWANRPLFAKTKDNKQATIAETLGNIMNDMDKPDFKQPPTNNEIRTWSQQGDGRKDEQGGGRKGVTSALGWREQAWYDATEYTRSTRYHETSDHGDTELWWYDDAHIGGIDNGSFGMKSFGLGSGSGSMSSKGGSDAHLLPMTSSSSSSFGSSKNKSNKSNTSNGQQQSGSADDDVRPAPSHYLKTLWVEHMEDDDNSYNVFSNEIQRLKRLRHSNILHFTGCQLVEEDINWKMNLIYASDGIRYQPLSKFMTTAKSIKTKSELDLGDMLNVCLQIATALEWLHNPSKSGGSTPHLHLNLDTVLLGRTTTPTPTSASPRGAHRSKLPILSSRAKWQIKLSALELEMVNGSAFCEDDIYEDNTNAPAFVAPELLLGGDGSETSDVYSFGILLWCAMTRRTPFESEASRTIGRLVLSEKRRPEYTMRELANIPQDVPLVQHMTECWSHETKKRPTMATLRSVVDDMYRKMRAYNGFAASMESKLKSFRQMNVVASSRNETKEVTVTAEVEIEMVEKKKA